MNPHLVLGVTPRATQQEVKEAYRRLCKQHHPDLVPPAQRAAAEGYFKTINQAYKQLTTRGAAGFSYAGTTAAGAAQGEYSAGFKRPWSAGNAGKGAPRFSNGVVAAVLAVPLMLSGIYSARALSTAGEDSWRPGGLLNPPVNPYLKEELLPRYYSHRKPRTGSKPAGTSPQQQQQQQQQAGAG